MIFFSFFGRLDAEDWRKKKTVLEFRNRRRGRYKIAMKICCFGIRKSNHAVDESGGNDLVLHLYSFFYRFSHSFGQFTIKKKKRDG